MVRPDKIAGFLSDNDAVFQIYYYLFQGGLYWSFGRSEVLGVGFISFCETTERYPTFLTLLGTIHNNGIHPL